MVISVKLIGLEWYVMCGIVGLFLKNKSMESSLGTLFTPMLIEMTDRGLIQRDLQSIATK